jgi:UDP-2,3-diacylglucosamine hydrolase
LKRLFISDLHLTDPASRQFRTLAAVLAAARRDVDEIYLLGDLCEVWIGDDDDGPLAQALIDLLRDSVRYRPVRIMAGNRDFLLGSAFTLATGVQLIPDPHLLEDGVLLAHGDAFCSDDGPYQQLRAQFRSTDWQREILARSLITRRALANQLRAQSQTSNANKPENIMDVNAGTLARVMADYGAHTLIHGHTHRPGVHQTDWGTRYVLGAWAHCAWLLHQDGPGGFRLSCQPLLR